jgi:hypothetical protein
MDNLPHKGRKFEPWAGDPPEGWPYTYVAAVDFDALAARLAEAEEALRLIAHNAHMERESASIARAFLRAADSADVAPRCSVCGLTDYGPYRPTFCSRPDCELKTASTVTGAP